MAELKDHQQQEADGKLPCHSRLTLVFQVLVPCWNQMHIPIFESSKLEGLYVGDLLYMGLQKFLQIPSLKKEQN